MSMLYSERQSGKRNVGSFSVLQKLCKLPFEKWVVEPGSRDALEHFFLRKTKNTSMSPFTYYSATGNENALFDMLECGYQYLKDFNVKRGEYKLFVLYEVSLNQTLREWGYEMQDGLIQQLPEAGMEQLVNEVVEGVEVPGAEAKMTHAIDSFFKRDATIEDKKSAIKALGDLLEHERDKLKSDQFLKGDEKDIFMLLNAYGIRHHKTDQKTLEEPYLSWAFYAVLNTLKTYLKLQK